MPVCSTIHLSCEVTQIWFTNSSITRYHKVSQGITKYHKVSQGITKYHSCSCTLRLFRFFPRGRVLPRTLNYLFSTPLFWVFTQTPIPISVTDQNNFILNIFLSSICISGHFSFSSDKDDRLIAILLDTSVAWSLSGLSKIFKKVLRLGVSQSQTRVFFERGLLPCTNRRKSFAGW